MRGGSSGGWAARLDLVRVQLNAAAAPINSHCTVFSRHSLRGVPGSVSCADQASLAGCRPSRTRSLTTAAGGTATEGYPDAALVLHHRPPKDGLCGRLAVG
jgi:hypothetical protein